MTLSAKTASARVLLALAFAALMLAGCGGGSSDSSSSTAATSGTTADADSGSGEANPDSGEAGLSSGGGSKKGSATGVPGTSASGAQSSSGQSSSEGRHGPPVPLPTGKEAPKITPQQRREAAVANISLQSPSSLASSAGPEALPPQYTCDGENTSPALRWQGVPQGTAELVLFAMNLRPVDGTLFFDWAVAGLDPELEEVEAGKLPKGAVAGHNSFGKTGYGICPEGAAETYIFTLFALPKKLSPSRGFDPLALRKEVGGLAGNAGILALSYTRG